MARSLDPYSQYSDVIDRFEKLKKSFIRLVEDNRKLQDKRAKIINPYEQKLDKLTKENEGLKTLLEANCRVIRKDLESKLGYNDPTKERTMEDIITVDGTDIPVVPITDVKHYTVTFDAGGNEVRTECEAPVFVQGEEGAVATEYVEV